MPIPEPVRELAVYPFRVLPKAPEVERVDFDGVWASFNQWPSAQLVFFNREVPTDLAATVEAVRGAARARGKKTLAWWVPPEIDDLAPELEACGLVNEDTPGFERIENAMALVEEPDAQISPELEIRVADTYEDWRAGASVSKTAFGMPDVPEDQLRARYEDYCNPESISRSFVAFPDGQAVGSSYAAFDDVGAKLFGGSVLEEARWHGVYRSLVRARWDHAVQRGAPALTVQAGRMSRPILERLGFQLIEEVRVFVDDVSSSPAST